MALKKPTDTIINKSTLAANTTTPIGTSDVVDLTESAMQSLTVNVEYGASASNPVRAHVRTSPEGTLDANFDTVDVGANQQGYWDIPLTAGSTVQSTTYAHPDAKYVKVLVENRDANIPTGSLTVKAVAQEVAPT